MVYCSGSDDALPISTTATSNDMESIVPTELVCANWGPGADICNAKSRFSCANCHLVAYCSKACQEKHWPTHKKDCKCSLGKSNWRPAWEHEDRNPFMTDSGSSRPRHNPFGGGKYLWGNAPAIDLLCLERNEGIPYDNDIELLFAASGDLRNVVQTIAAIPDTYVKGIRLAINDREFEVVARNVVILLYVLSSLDDDISHNASGNASIAESLIHLWYSAFLPAKLLSDFRCRVQPLITEVCSRIRHKGANAVVAKTWTFNSQRKIRLVLKTREWLQLETYFDVSDVPHDTAQLIRTSVTLAPERADFRDRWCFKEATTFTRVAKKRFREDGLLLPFGHPRTIFEKANPTFFRDSKTWLMDDKSDPLDGWPIWEVRRWPSVAKEDIYAKLFGYLRSRFKAFLLNVRRLDIMFEMYRLDAQELPDVLSKDRYTRIEVSNIADSGYVGIHDILARFIPLLESPKNNPHAALITLFMNAVMETVQRRGRNNEIPNMDQLLKYLPFPHDIAKMMKGNSADTLRMWDARTLVLDVEKYFQEYMVLHDFKHLSTIATMKSKNSIVESWPTRLKLSRGQAGSQEEFDVLLGSNFSGLEHYVEWKRIA